MEERCVGYEHEEQEIEPTTSDIEEEQNSWFHLPSQLHYEIDVDHTKDGSKTIRHDHNYNFCRSHNSLHFHEKRTNSHGDNDIVEPSNAELNVKDQWCVVDSCHKESNFFYLNH